MLLARLHLVLDASVRIHDLLDDLFHRHLGWHWHWQLAMRRVQFGLHEGVGRWDWLRSLLHWGRLLNGGRLLIELGRQLVGNELLLVGCLSE